MGKSSLRRGKRNREGKIRRGSETFNLKVIGGDLVKAHTRKKRRGSGREGFVGLIEILTFSDRLY